MFGDVVGDREDSDWSLGNAVLTEVRETKAVQCVFTRVGTRGLVLGLVVFFVDHRVRVSQLIEKKSQLMSGMELA